MSKKTAGVTCHVSRIDIHSLHEKVFFLLKRTLNSQNMSFFKKIEDQI